MARILVLLTLLSLASASPKETRLGKCCPAGEVFSGRSKVNCVPTPRHATELYSLHYNDTSYRDGVPGCEELEDITTTPLADLDADDFLQAPACLEVLHEESSRDSVPIVVHCRSSKDRNLMEGTPSVPLPSIIDLRRCCPRDKFFESATKTCVSPPEVSRGANYTEIEEFLLLLPKYQDSGEFLRITRGPPTCQAVIFDYEVGVEDIIYNNRTLYAMLPPYQGETRKTKINLSEQNACLELTPESQSNRKLIVRACMGSEYCQKNTCVRKCCSEDEMLLPRTGCSSEEISDDLIDFHLAFSNVSKRTETQAKEYGLLVGKPCLFGMYPILPEDNWSLTSEGHVKVPGYQTYQHHQYCMDVLYNSTEYEEGFYPFVCFEDPANEEAASVARYKVNTVLEVTSCAFLLITLLVYACLPLLQNLHGKTLMCHVASLLLAYVCLAMIPWVTPNTYHWESEEEPIATIFCSTLGYTMLFSFLSAFCWLNVMCFDIWWTFGGLRGGSTRGRGHRKKFLLYCLYAWGVPLAMTSLGILADQLGILPQYLRPNIGLASCWFTQLQELYGELLFFVGPITVQLVANIVFFVLTAVHCSKVKAEISRVNADPSDPRSKRFQADRTKLVMNVKLFIVMGISWIMEIISFFLAKYVKKFQWQEELFYATDVFNSLQGLLIFILFVVKARVYLALRRRLGFGEKKKGSSQATTALQDPYRVKKSASNSTLTSNFAVSVAP